MKYFVKTADGELEYESYVQLQKAAATGLVDADDLVRREDQQDFKKASALPGLLRAGARRSLFGNPMVRWLTLDIGLALIAFGFIRVGVRDDKPEYYAGGIALVFVVAFLLIRLTTNAQKRK